MRWRRCSAALLVVLAAACGGSSEAKPKVVVPAVVRTTPVVPRIDAAMKAHLRSVFEAGQARGNRAGVFAKIGDSNTAIPDFLVPVGCGEVVYGRWEATLRPVVERWSSTPVPHGWELERCEASNSFTRVGSAAFPGWRTKDLLRAATPHPADCQPPDDVAVRCELAQIRPAVALVMIGTNDMLLDDESIDPSGLEHFRPRLVQLLEEIEEAGVIPVVSTLPHRRHPGPSAEPLPPLWNEVIIDVAGEVGVPVWNLWRALEATSQNGLAFDLLHLSPAPTGAGDLRDQAMGWGFNVRNLTALQVLEKVGRIVIDDGPPDP